MTKKTAISTPTMVPVWSLSSVGRGVGTGQSVTVSETNKFVAVELGIEQFYVSFFAITFLIT